MPEVWPLPWDPEPKTDAYKGEALPLDELNKAIGWSPEMIEQWRGGNQ